jgi:methionine aminopeptidase
VKLDLGCHLDGYFAHVGCTIIISSDPAKKHSGQIANLITAGYTALQAAIRKCVVGSTNDDVTRVIEKVAEQYGFSPIEGTYSHKHKKHTLDEKHVIMNKHVVEKK